MIYCAAWLVTGALLSISERGQLLPPAGDGDIRAVYWELRNETEVWLTLEPKSATGKPAPLLTFARRFAGKWPASQATDFEVRAYAGSLWAPSVEFWLVLDDDHKIDLGSQGRAFGLISGTPSDYLTATLPVQTLKQMAHSKRVAGHALGFEFELNESQRRALGAFLERALSENPARLPRSPEVGDIRGSRSQWLNIVSTTAACGKERTRSAGPANITLEPSALTGSRAPRLSVQRSADQVSVRGGMRRWGVAVGNSSVWRSLSAS